MKNSNSGNQRNQQSFNTGNVPSYKKPTTHQAASNDVNVNKDKTSTIRIDSTFKGPVEVDGWRVSVNRQNRIVCTPIDNTLETLRHRTFTYEVGTVFIKTSPTNSYVYFRTDGFQAFLTECGEPRIINADPNGEYHAIHGETKDSVYDAVIICDGSVKRIETPLDEVPVINSRRTNSGGVPNKFYKVEGSKVAIFDKIKFDAKTFEYTVYRSIVTQSPVTDIADIIREMVKNNNTAIEKMKSNRSR